MMGSSSSSSYIYQQQSPAATISGEALKTQILCQIFIDGFSIYAAFLNLFTTLEINFTRQGTLGITILELNFFLNRSGGHNVISCSVSDAEILVIGQF